MDKLKEHLGKSLELVGKIAPTEVYEMAWKILIESINAYNTGANRNSIPTHYLLKQMGRIETELKAIAKGGE